jgi:hypothetical protein
MVQSCRSALGWLFRDRRTGRIVIAQLPNIPLLVWFGTSVLGWLLNPHGRWGTVLEVTSAAALVVWAGDEIVRGVNPWRRILGATVLGFVVVSWAVAP